MHVWIARWRGTDAILLCNPPPSRSPSPLHHAFAGVVGGVGGALVLCAAAFLAYKLWGKKSTPAQFQSSPAYDATNTYQAPAVAQVQQPAQLAPEDPWR